MHPSDLLKNGRDSGRSRVEQIVHGLRGADGMIIDMDKEVGRIASCNHGPTLPHPFGYTALHPALQWCYWVDLVPSKTVGVTLLILLTVQPRHCFSHGQNEDADLEDLHEHANCVSTKLERAFAFAKLGQQPFGQAGAKTRKGSCERKVVEWHI
jgi:hypothetical protein